LTLGFSLPEFARILAVTGPPERRGVRAPKRAAAANTDTPPSTLPDLAPDDDCEEGGEQLRRIFDGVARLGASPTWVALQPGDARIGIWCLDLIDDDGEEDDPDAEAVPSSAARRARGAGPVWCEPPPGGVLGPIDLATLVHRPDWALWVIETARHVREFADAQVFASGVDHDAAETLMGEAFHLSYAYQHAHAVHDPVPEADRYVLAAHRAVADALSSVMFVLAAASLSGRRDAGRGPAPDN
jgi:hypothetical protein